MKGDGFCCDSDLHLRGIECNGELRLLGVEIGGNLICSGSSLIKPDGSALLCDRARVRGSVFLRDGFKAEGEVRLVGAEIGSNLSCGGGSFMNPNGNALSCDNSKVTGQVNLVADFKAEGTVRLLGSQIGGDLVCTGGSFKKPAGEAFSCDNAKVKGSLFWRRIQLCEGTVSFDGLSVGDLLDDGDPKASNLILDGLIYGGFNGGAPTDAESRIRWLKFQLPSHLYSDFKPQPWEQCIKVLREMGHDGEARKVAVAKQQALRDADKVGNFPQRQLHWLYGLLAGYGYEPLRTVAAMALVWLLSATAFDIAGDLGLMGPSSPFILANESISDVCGVGNSFRETMWTVCSALPQEYTTFNSWLYSLDLILPLVDLQQDADWSPLVMKDDGVSNIWQGHVFRALMWFEILFGWLASLLLVAVLGNLVKKD